MSFTLEEAQVSHEIIAHLLEKRALYEMDEPALYRSFKENETVQELVRSQAESLRCSVARYSDVIYLIPREDNDFLGYSKAELKRELCHSKATDRDYYLVQFTILVLLLEFYDGQGSSSAKTRDFIRVGELQNSIADHLKEGVSQMEEETQQEEGVAFSDMLQAYESLRSERGSKKLTTKEGFLGGILHFLSDQGLIQYVEQDGVIKTTRKLDHFMDWNLLNRTNYHHVMMVLGARPEEVGS